MNIPDLEPPIADDAEVIEQRPDSEPAVVENNAIPDPAQSKLSGRSRREFLWLAVTFAAGLGSGYVLRGWPLSRRSNPVAEAEVQISLPEEYTLPVTYDDLGPRLLESGAIDYDKFTQVYQEAGQPLSPEQLAILTAGSGAPVVINRETAYFLLNLFWATGLVNQNPILTEGTMMQYGGEEEIGGFASTGGWTIGAKPATELYASTPLFELTSAQQARLEEVAGAIYRPCCNNPTSFPDCNHGMAMLGVLELMAAHDATGDEMFAAAKHFNAFWFPQQTYELALAFNQGKDLEFAEIEASELVSVNFSSGAGFRAVHQWLAENNLLNQVPNSGNNCGV